MEDATAGLCSVNNSRVYRDGVLARCTYHFGHGGKHSWEDKHIHNAWWQERGTSRLDRDDGKLASEEAEMLPDTED